MNSWVLVIKKRMGDVLRSRLENAIEAWNVTFDDKNDSDDDGDEEKKEEMSKTPKLKLPTIGLEILLRNQEISIERIAK